MEIEWARRNPWGGGANRYALPPGYFAPLMPDSGRRELLSRERVVMYATIMGPQGERLVYTAEERAYSLPLFRLAGRHRDEGRLQVELRRFLRRARRKGEPGLLLLHLSDPPEELELLRQFISVVSEGGYFNRRLLLAPFDPTAGREEHPEAINPSLLQRPLGDSPFSLETHRGLRQAAAERRHSGSGQERRKRILHAFVEKRAQERDNRRYGGGRVYTAAMHGSAEIVGDRFSVQTEDGRPASLVTPGGEIGVGTPAVTTVRLAAGLAGLDDERCRVESVTAFAFEGALSRGIREETTLEGELSGRVRLDTYFVDGYSELFLSLEARVAGKAGNCLLLTPVEFAVLNHDEEVSRVITLIRRLSAGRTIEERFSLQRGEGVPLFGEELLVGAAGGGTSLRCASVDLPDPAIAPSALLRPASQRGRRQGELSFAPFGSILFRKGRRQELLLRRTVRLAPGNSSEPFRRLTETVAPEILLWEGQESEGDDR